MLKSLTINWPQSGHARGTLGWLHEQACGVKVGEDNRGLVAAWLVDESGSTIIRLAERVVVEDADHNPRAVIRECERGWGGPYWTDAAWSAIVDLSDRAGELIEQHLEASDAAGYGITMTVAGDTCCDPDGTPCPACDGAAAAAEEVSL